MIRIRNFALLALASMLCGGCAVEWRGPVVYGPPPVVVDPAPPVVVAPAPAGVVWIDDPFYGHCYIDGFGLLWYADGGVWISAPGEYNHWHRDGRGGWHHDGGFHYPPARGGRGGRGGGHR